MMKSNPFTLEGKNIMVTGASSGIGRGIAIECSKMGANLVVSGRNPERLDETFSMLTGDGHVEILADLSTQDGIDLLVEKAPILHGCVHSAGIPNISTVKHIDRMQLEEIIRVNEMAPMLLTSSLLRTKKLQRKSSIVFIASMSGIYMANIGESLYASTKGALSGFVKTAALELASQGIRVNSVCPGLVPTRILNLSNTIFSEEQLQKTMYGRYPLKRVGTPEDIAYATIYLLSDASSWVTGINLLVDGGYCLS